MWKFHVSCFAVSACRHVYKLCYDSRVFHPVLEFWKSQPLLLYGIVLLKPPAHLLPASRSAAPSAARQPRRGSAASDGRYAALLLRRHCSQVRSCIPLPALQQSRVPVPNSIRGLPRPVFPAIPPARPVLPLQDRLRPSAANGAAFHPPAVSTVPAPA